MNDVCRRGSYTFRQIRSLGKENIFPRVTYHTLGKAMVSQRRAATPEELKPLIGEADLKT